MKKVKMINTTPDGCAYGIKASYFKNAAITTLTGGGIIGTVTTMVTKDLLIIELYEDGHDDMPQQ